MILLITNAVDFGKLWCKPHFGWWSNTFGKHSLQNRYCYCCGSVVFFLSRSVFCVLILNFFPVLHAVTCWSQRRNQSRLTFYRLPCHSALSFLDLKGNFPATDEPTVETPPATADTPSFTSPTPIKGTVVTADLVISRLLPPTQATPPTAAPTTPLVTLNKPPVTRHIMLGGTTWSSPESEHIERHMRERGGGDMRLIITATHLSNVSFSFALKNGSWKRALPCVEWLFCTAASSEAKLVQGWDCTFTWFTFLNTFENTH